AAREYLRVVRQVASLLEGHPNLFDKGATVRLGSRCYARVLENLHKPFLKHDNSLLDQLREELAAWPDEISPDIWIVMGHSAEENPYPSRKFTEAELKERRDTLRKVDNPFGKRVISEGFPCSTFILPMQQGRVESRRIQIALRLYQTKHGHLPEQLDDLV